MDRRRRQQHRLDGGSGSDGFYGLVLFIPGYKESLDTPGEYDAPWGEWAARSFVAPEAWTQDKDYNEGDLAAFTVQAPAGYTQFYCTGDVVDAMNWNPLDNRLEMNCDMGAGASGGPMATTEGQIVGANSHVETDDQDQRINDHLYSSDHGDQAVAVINAINDAN
ncbi:hypothetical protein [Streptomyces sp. DH41]|uniref:hypothetical protein n=1 Tax=Streptomyces sp. DH41 TaxID=3040125 RepID=UPI0024420EE6|nr:hypothetical protein [Streptomyces sp. DH41]MDG9723518.1 hypothetical protein [Streptomyces sp. DH41]